MHHRGTISALQQQHHFAGSVFGFFEWCHTRGFLFQFWWAHLVICQLCMTAASMPQNNEPRHASENVDTPQRHGCHRRRHK
jgi:hypothetical protein